MDNLFSYLAKLGTNGFYGNIEIIFQEGKVVLVKEIKSLKFKDL
jgi:hypothetical protein